MSVASWFNEVMASDVTSALLFIGIVVCIVLLVDDREKRRDARRGRR